MVSDACQAAALDTIEKALRLSSLDLILVSTNSRAFAQQVSGLPVQVAIDPPGEPFHFGRRFHQLIRQYEVNKVLYLGGGSGVLLTMRELEQIVSRLKDNKAILITNNYYSTDFAAFSPASAVANIELPSTDNDLSWRLVRAGLPLVQLPRSASTMLDIDTPSDLLTVAYHPHLGRHLRDYIRELNLDMTLIERAIAVLRDPSAQIAVLGRVPSTTWAYLERQAACQTRVFSEERGMRASGRLEKGEVRSFLGYLLEAVGPERFVQRLTTVCDAAFIDSRVLFAHMGFWPSTPDRFNSDLRCPDRINDPFVREFTIACLNASIPIVLGGHSLVSGGLYALVEAMASPQRGKNQ